MDFASKAILILSVLDSHGKLSQKEIVAQTQIPERTVRYNLKKLLKTGAVKERILLDDLRFKLFERGDGLCL